MNKEELLLLFKNEEYDKAVLEIKKALKDDSDNGELFYYLFLAENRDYSNMDINNIVNEANFNKALELSGRRLRNEFEAEYNFYTNCNDDFRKMFCYACRGIKEPLIEMIKKYVDSNNVKPKPLSTNKVDFLDNLDYIVSVIDNKESIDLILLVLNYAYIIGRDEKIADIYNKSIKKFSSFDSEYLNRSLVTDEKELFASDDEISKALDDEETLRLKKELYMTALNHYKENDYQNALKIFLELGDYENSTLYYKKCEILINDEKKRKEQKKKLARKNRKKKIKKVLIKSIEILETVFQFLIIAAPVALAVILGIILFSNQEQIEIISNFAGWCTGWVFYIIGSVALIITQIVCLVKKIGLMGSEWYVRISTLLVIFAVAMSSWFSFANSSKLKADFYAPNMIDFIVTKKESYEDNGYRMTKIYIDFKNDLNVDVTYIDFDMKIYNGDYLVDSTSWDTNGIVFEANSVQKNIRAIVKEENDKPYLYYTSYDNMRIDASINMMKFKNGSKEYTYTSDQKIYKTTINNNGYENFYNTAITLYNALNYYDAKLLFAKLGDYKDSQTYLKLCQDAGY